MWDINAKREVWGSPRRPHDVHDVVFLRPTDNDRYVRNAPENPKKVRELYFAFRQ